VLIVQTMVIKQGKKLVLALFNAGLNAGFNGGLSHD
jgi:hypothetical protein